ncbi:MAG: WYL domain-containing protein, partial [Natronospirillum sp.]|uniref:helix-turn-helix transcriptional regulator n=1 Tax=Natronospirillum sp. TaxID=2812955 RepID=UPI0025E0249A
MPEHHDTLARMIKMLQMIPAAPGRIATTTLQSKLEEQGFQITLRSLQRDLKRMEYFFPIQCDDSEKPHRWSFDSHYSRSFPGMDADRALTLVLADDYLRPLLPSTVMDAIAPQVNEARQFLDGLESNHLARWRRQVRAISQGRSLLPAPIDPDIWRQVTAGLLQGRALQVTYQTRTKETPDEYVIHPQGLVHRDSVTYLLATVKTYNDILQFALHRFSAVSISDQAYRPQPDFDVDAYIASGGFGYAASAELVELKAWVSPELRVRLSETPLTEGQTLTFPDDSGWGYLQARVNDEQAMQWWL